MLSPNALKFKFSKLSKENNNIKKQHANMTRNDRETLSTHLDRMDKVHAHAGSEIENFLQLYDNQFSTLLQSIQYIYNTYMHVESSFSLSHGNVVGASSTFNISNYLNQYQLLN